MRRTGLLLALVLFLTASCSPKYGPGTEKPGPPEPVSAPAKADVEEANPDQYHDFKDILIPREMKLDADSSLLFETAHLKAGRICFKGWVDPVSLFDFFIENMPKDQWTLRSYFKYGVYLLVFEKPDRDCIISIHKDTWSTWLEVWVTPRLARSPAE